MRDTVKGVRSITFFYALFLLCSMIGWVAEMLYYIVIGSGVLDRGFLSLPLCPVYGLSCVVTYLCFGLPQRPRFFALSLPLTAGRFAAFGRSAYYFVVGALCATFFELASGVFMHRFLGVRLWDYSNLRLHVFGYISFAFAVMFGALMLFFMRFCFPLLLRRIAKIPHASLCAALVPMTVLLLFDIALNCTYSYTTHTHLALWT